MDRGINTFAMHSGLTEEDFGWGSPNFHKMVSWHAERTLSIAVSGPEPVLERSVTPWAHVCLQGREKIQLIYKFTKMGFDILVADVDTVWWVSFLPTQHLSE